MGNKLVYFVDDVCSISVGDTHYVLRNAMFQPRCIMVDIQSQMSPSHPRARACCTKVVTVQPTDETYDTLHQISHDSFRISVQIM